MFDAITQKKVINTFLENQRENGQLSKALDNNVKGTVMYGSTVDAYTLDAVSAGEYTGGALDVQEIGTTKKTMTIDQASYFAVNLKSLEVKNNEINIPRGVLEDGTGAVNQLKEEYVGEVMLAGAGTVLGASDAKIEITEANAYSTIVKLHLGVKKLSKKPTGVRYAFVSPSYAAILKLDPRVQKSTEVFEKDLLIEGTIAKIDGVFVVETMLAPKDTVLLVDRRAGSFKDGYDETDVVDMGTAGFGKLLKSLYVYGAKIWYGSYVGVAHVNTKLD